MGITHVSRGDNEHVEAVGAEDVAYCQGQRSNSYCCDGGHQLGSGSSQGGEQAADQGFASAQINLGNMYQDGRGVPQDAVLAHMWYSLASTQSKDGKHKDRAIKNLDSVVKYMNPKQVAEAKQMAGDWKFKGK